MEEAEGCFLHWLFSGHKQSDREKKETCPGNSHGTDKKEKKPTKENPAANGTCCYLHITEEQGSK